MKNFFIFILINLTTNVLNAQDIDKIIKKFYQVSGKVDYWKKITALKSEAEIMMDSPFGVSNCIDTLYEKEPYLFLVGRNCQNENNAIKKILHDGKNVWNIKNDITYQRNSIMEDGLKMAKYNKVGDFILAKRICDYKKQGYTMKYVEKRVKNENEYHVINMKKEVYDVNQTTVQFDKRMFF